MLQSVNAYIVSGFFYGLELRFLFSNVMYLPITVFVLQYFICDQKGVARVELDKWTSENLSLYMQQQEEGTNELSGS